MKLLKTTAIAGLLAVSGAATAVEVSGNVALTSDYMWRGLSQTDASPAIQGGFDASFDSGFYAGIWGSNVDFKDDVGNSTNESMEIDTYAGWAGEFGGVGVDVGFLNYHYPTADDGTNFTEAYTGLSFGPVSLTYYMGLDLGTENMGDTNVGDYTDLGIDLGGYSGVNFSAHFGHYDMRDGDNYDDWKLAASTSLMDVDFELAYVDQDADSDEQEQVVFTVSKSL